MTESISERMQRVAQESASRTYARLLVENEQRSTKPQARRVFFTEEQVQSRERALAASLDPVVIRYGIPSIVPFHQAGEDFRILNLQGTRHHSTHQGDMPLLINFTQKLGDKLLREASKNFENGFVPEAVLPAEGYVNTGFSLDRIVKLIKIYAIMTIGPGNGWPIVVAKEKDGDIFVQLTIVT